MFTDNWPDWLLAVVVVGGCVACGALGGLVARWWSERVYVRRGH